MDGKEQVTEVIDYCKKIMSGDSLVTFAYDDGDTDVPCWTKMNYKDANPVFGDATLGIPGGRIIEVYGPESQGKSALAYYMIGQFQTSGGLAALADIEQSFRKEWASKLGVDHSTLMRLQLGERKIKSKFELEGMEDLFIKIENLIEAANEKAPGLPLLCVWDTVAATPPRKELAGDYGEEGMALQARALSAGLRKLYNSLKYSNVTLLCLNQVRAKFGAFTYDDTTGGRALKFYSSVRVKVRRVSQIERKATKGIQVVAQNMKNKLAPPFESVHFEVTTAEGLKFYDPEARKRKR